MVEHFDPRIKFCQEVDNYKNYPVGITLKDGSVVINSEAASHWMGDRIDYCSSEVEGKCGTCGWSINCGYFKKVATKEEGR